MPDNDDDQHDDDNSGHSKWKGQSRWQTKRRTKLWSAAGTPRDWNLAPALLIALQNPRRRASLWTIQEADKNTDTDTHRYSRTHTDTDTAAHTDINSIDWKHQLIKMQLSLVWRQSSKQRHAVTAFSILVRILNMLDVLDGSKNSALGDGSGDKSPQKWALSSKATGIHEVWIKVPTKVDLVLQSHMKSMTRWVS